MPISTKEYNTGRTSETLEAKILTFLEQNNQKAYTLSEIINVLGYNIELEGLWGIIGGVAELFTYQNALKQLMEEGKITAKIIQEGSKQETYYKAVEKGKASIDFS